MKKTIKFLLIGLTGAYGSGCTTLAQAICNESTSFVKQDLIDNINDRIKQIYKDINKLSQNETKDLVKIKELSHELNEILSKRKYINEVLRFEAPEIQYISMSSILVAASLLFIGSESYNKFKSDNIDVCKKISDFNDIWREVINIYFTKNEYEEYEYTQIDSFLVAVESLKSDIKEAECGTENGTESLLQYWGDNYRKYGNPFGGTEISYVNAECLAEKTKKLIKYYKNRKDTNKKTCFVIDAFRNPAEVDYFRKRYAQFYLISLYADKEVRKHRILVKSKHKNDFSEWFERIDRRDSGDDNDITDFYSQNVSRCCYLSDIAIGNNIRYKTYSLDNELVEKLLKYYALLISPGCVPPSKEETLMNLAYSISLRSTCISRKVGAVITDKKGFIVGMGWNDVAHTQIGCGYLTADDYKTNSTYLIDLLKSNSDSSIDEVISELPSNFAFCYKDALSQKKVHHKVNNIDFKSIIKKYLPEKSSDSIYEDIDKNVKDKIKKTISIKRLEYCRSLHAEENALLQVASRGGVGVEGGAIYTSTFPCELCAKKIYQSGIKEVYYTEPYPNSISESVFLKDGVNDIKLIPFEGVKSSAYYRLYKTPLDLKESQLIDYY